MLNLKYDKILHLVGAQKTNFPWGFENRLIPAFESMGFKVISTDFRQEKDRLPELLLKKADIVLICKGEGIPSQLIRSAPCVTALWYAEQIGTPDNYDDLAQFRRNELSFNVGSFDYVFSHDQGNLDVYKGLGAKRVAWLSCAAVDPDVNCKINASKQHDVVFIGSKTPRRQRILFELERRGITVYSPDIWDPKKLNQIFNESRIVLNIHLSDLLNTETRIAEVIGSGSFLLSEKISSPDLLTEGKHYVNWSPGNTDELVEKIVYYLSHEMEREKIAQEGYRYIHEHHTYEKRIETFLDSIDFDLNQRIWPSYELGFLFDSNGQPTLRQDSFYCAISETLSKTKKPKKPEEMIKLPNKEKSYAQNSPSHPYKKASHPDSKRGHLRIFAAFSNVNWEDNNLQPALEHFGEVIRFQWNFYDQYKPSWHFSDKMQMNHRMLEALRSAHQEKPVDLFFGYVSGRTVFPGVIRSIGEMGIPTLCLSLDDKAKFFGNLEPTGYTGMVDIANAFTLCWTSTEDAINKYESVGAKVIYLPSGANPDVFRPYNIPRDIDVSFIGQKYGQRISMIEEIRKRGIDVKTFGKGWESGEISQEEMIKLYSRSKITLGFAEVAGSKDLLCLKGRDFEVPMSGGFYLTQYHPELEKWFEIGKEIECYKDIDEMVEKIHYYLAHSEHANRIREASRQKSIENHTWVGRFEHAFETMGIYPVFLDKKQGDYKESEFQYNEDKMVSNMLKQGEELYHGNNLEKAKDVFKEILSINPNHVEALNNLGVLAFQQDDLELAVSMFEQVYSIKKDYIESIENMGKCFEVKGEYNRALKWFERSLSLGEKSVDTLNSTGNCYVQLEDLSKAKKAYLESLRLDNTQENIKELLRRLETTSQSVEHSKVTRDRRQKDNPEFLVNINTDQKKKDQENTFNILKENFSKTYYTLKSYNNDKFTTPLWNNFNAKIEKDLLPIPPFSFLRNSTIAWTMVVSGGNWLVQEIDFLEKIMGIDRLTILLKEDFVGDPIILNSPYNTSANSIHHLYHLTRFSEETKRDLIDVSTVIEWGGGYGNMAKLFRRFNNKHTYTIIDTALFSCLQWLYLSTIFGEDSVNILRNSEDSIYKGKINLLPVCFAESIDLCADLFIATWSLSESSTYSQNYVKSHKFFNAEHLLIAYQDNNDDLPDADRVGSIAENFGAIIKDIDFLPGNHYAFK